MASPNTSPTPRSPGRWVVSAFGGPSVLKWQEDKTLPTTYPGQALVRILIAGISGADNIMRAGGYSRNPLASKPGFTPGYDLVGVVEAVNEDAQVRNDTTIRTGDLVATMSVVGGYATHTVVPLDECLILQPNEDLVKAAALPLNYMTAYGMMTMSKFPITSSTESILIGSVAGGVGVAIAQLTKLFFPHVQMFGTCSPSKFDFINALCVTPIDRNTPPEQLPKAIHDLTSGKGVSIAYDAIGSPESMASFLNSTTPATGKLIAIGFIGNVATDGSGVVKEPFNPIAFCDTQPTRMAFFSVTNMYWKAQRDTFRKDFEDVLLRAVREGKLNPVIGGLYRLSDAVKINEMLAGGQGVMGKLEMIVDEELWKKHTAA